MNKSLTIVAIGTFALLVVIGVWFFFLRPETQIQNPTTETLGSGNNIPTTVRTETSGTNQPVTVGQTKQQIIFKIAEGPVTGAALIQTLHPTTTIARYVLQENGHVFDLAIDSPGAVPKAVSNTTIPATARAVWVEKGSGVILQYLDNEVIKTAYFGFPASSTQATKIQFLPNNISDLSASPDGKSLAYLIPTINGTDGYTAKSDGSGSKKLFSLPLSQLLLSWPSQNTLLLQTNSTLGVPGVAFSINTQGGAVLPLMYAPGLSAAADQTFGTVVYQTTLGSARLTFSRNVKKGTDTLLPFTVVPEKCLWSRAATSTLYCAAPFQNTPANYLDLWHQGTAAFFDSIFRVNLQTNITTIAANPGGSDGGVPSDIAELALSPDEKYLLFVKKGDRSLWGTRLQ